MNIKLLSISLMAGLTLTAGAFAQESKEAAMHRKAAEIISQMTLEEKIGPKRGIPVIPRKRCTIPSGACASSAS